MRKQGTGNKGLGAAQTTETSRPGDGGRREFRRPGDKDSLITGRDGVTFISP